MKKVFIVITLVVIAVLAYLLSILLLNPVQLSLLMIPQDKVFYYYEDKKQELTKKFDLQGIYFIHPKYPIAKIRIGNTLYVNFYSHIDESKINSIFRNEHLTVVEKNDWLGQNYLVKTTQDSKYKDGLQMSNYLHDSHPDIIQYAEPNNMFQADNPFP